MSETATPTIEGSNSCEEWEWEDLCDAITNFMYELSKEPSEWHATVENFGWRNLNGEKDFIAENGAKLLSGVLPNTECSFTITLEEDHILINNAHHDKPTGGELYKIYPVNS